MTQQTSSVRPGTHPDARPGARAGATADGPAADGAPLHAMFVHAHPDDESSKGAGTMARLLREGHAVTVVTLTDGAAGDILNPAMDRPGVKENLVALRREELARALAILGGPDSVWLGYPDSGYVEGFEGDASVLDPDCFYNRPFDEVLARLVAVVRDRRPDVLVTYPPGGGYPHPDHIRCHEVSVAAFEAAADPDRFPDAGPPHAVSKLYWDRAFTRQRILALHDAAVARGIESPFADWVDGVRERPDDRVTTRVAVGDLLDVRKRALLAHATQIDPDGRWFSIPDDLVREVHPYEEYELARSRVAAPAAGDAPAAKGAAGDGRDVEDSLFAGLG